MKHSKLHIWNKTQPCKEQWRSNLSTNGDLYVKMPTELDKFSSEILQKINKPKKQSIRVLILRFAICENS